MRKGSSDILVDLRSLRVYGDVLDIGFQNEGIMYRALKKGISLSECDEAAATSDTDFSNEDYDWVNGNPETLPFNDASFDNVLVFFSLSYIRRKHLKNKLVKEIARILKDNGRIYIWDFNKRSFFSFRKKLKVILPGDETSIIYRKQPKWLSKYNMESMLPVIEHYFKVDESKDSGTSYFIEAGKKLKG